MSQYNFTIKIKAEDEVELIQVIDKLKRMRNIIDIQYQRPVEVIGGNKCTHLD